MDRRSEGVFFALNSREETQEHGDGFHRLLSHCS